MHGNKACCEDVYQTAATVSILVLVICFASTQRTDGQASGVSANELARRILMNDLEAEQRDQGHWSLRQMAKPKVETQKGGVKTPAADQWPLAYSRTAAESRQTNPAVSGQPGRM